MEECAFEVLQTGYVWPFPVVEKARASDKDVCNVLEGFFAIEILDFDMPLGSVIIPSCFDAFVTELYILSDVVFVCHSLPIFQYLWPTSVELTPLDIGLEAELVRVRRYV